MMKIASFSRRFPPDYKRKWYICRCSKGYLARYKGRTVKIYFDSLNHALEVCITDMPELWKFAGVCMYEKSL